MLRHYAVVMLFRYIVSVNKALNFSLMLLCSELSPYVVMLLA